MKAGGNVTQKGRCGKSQRRGYDDVSIVSNTVRQNNMQVHKMVSFNSLQKNLTRLSCRTRISFPGKSCNMITLQKTLGLRPFREAMSTQTTGFFCSRLQILC